jgi:hypothetical protein
MAAEYVLWSAVLLMNYEFCVDMLRVKAVSRDGSS